MNRNETKSGPAAAAGSGLSHASRSTNHQLLLDRLSKKPASLAPVAPAASPNALLPRGLAKSSTQPVTTERRSQPRRRMLKGGIISYKGSFAGLRCTVRDLSDTGARLRIADVVHVPDSFELIIEIDGLYAKSEAVWRKGRDIGVRFTEPVRSGNKLREQVITPRDGVRPR